MAKQQTNRHEMVNKTLHIKQTIAQHESHKKAQIKMLWKGK